MKKKLRKPTEIRLIVNFYEFYLREKAVDFKIKRNSDYDYTLFLPGQQINIGNSGSINLNNYKKVAVQLVSDFWESFYDGSSITCHWE